MLVGSDEEDREWPWDELLRIHENPSSSDLLYSREGVQSTALVCRDQVQGLMVTSLLEQHPRLSPMRKLVYIEYITVAPWNRPSARHRISKGAGPLLVTYAVLRSASEGREGRLALHSGGVKATQFYKGIGMRSYGPDQVEDHLDYFEGDTTWASSFLAKGRGT